MPDDASIRFQLTPYPTYDLSFKLENSVLNDASIPYHADNICGRQWRAQARSILIGEEATCRMFTGDTSRCYLGVDLVHTIQPNMPQPTAYCREGKDIGERRELAKNVCCYLWWHHRQSRMDVIISVRRCRCHVGVCIYCCAARIGRVE